MCMQVGGGSALPTDLGDLVAEVGVAAAQHQHEVAVLPARHRHLTTQAPARDAHWPGQMMAI